MQHPKQAKNRNLPVNDSRGRKGTARPLDQEGEQTLEFRAEVDRILESRTIKNSEALRKLLSYLAEKWITAGSESLKEYSIGVEAFDKPQDYDPQDDPSVRILASKLRHKLEEYYLREGADSRYRIEIPRGQFSLAFRTAPVEAAPPQIQLLQSRLRKWQLAATALGVIIILFSLFLVLKRPGPSAQTPVATLLEPWSPELDLIWNPFLNSSRSIIVALGTPLFTKFSSGFYRNPKINDEAQAHRAEEIQLLQKHLASPYAVPSHAYTGAGEAIGAFHLARLFQGRASGLSIERSSMMTWDDIRYHNVIFLGPPKFNPQLAEIPTQRGFVIRDGAIRNSHPQPGEQDAYRNSWAPNNTELLEDYALISRLGGLHGSGEIMALGAGSTEATWAAVEYVSQPLYASELVRKVGLVNGMLPGKYQVIIHVRFRRQVPIEIAYVTHRVLGQPQ